MDSETDPVSDKPTTATLAATSWALLGMMSYEEEVSGYDLKKWIDWSVDLYYWSPSYSQIYTELKKLEVLGLATSRVERDEGTRSRRLYKITPAGMDAVTEWTNHAPVDPPVLKHSVLLRVTFGHLSNPSRLKELLQTVGHKSCVTTQIGRHHYNDDALQIKRLPVNSEDNGQLFRSKLEGDYDWLALLQSFSKNIESVISLRRTPTRAALGITPAQAAK